MSVIIGNGGVNRTIKEPYIGDGGVNRKDKEIYVGNSGVNRKIYMSTFELPTVPINNTITNLPLIITPNSVLFKLYLEANIGSMRNNYSSTLDFRLYCNNNSGKAINHSLTNVTYFENDGGFYISEWFITLPFGDGSLVDLYSNSCTVEIIFTDTTITYKYYNATTNRTFGPYSYASRGFTERPTLATYLAQVSSSGDYYKNITNLVMK